MSLTRAVVFLSLASVLATAACSTTQENHSDSDFLNLSQSPVMRHTIREEVHYDSYKMTQLVNSEINLREPDESIFLKNVANVLAETALVQSHYREREDAIREVKGKVEQEDYSYVLSLATDILLDVLKTSQVPADQASALFALQNLVVEARTLRRPELRPTLQKIASANIKVGTAARDYAREPMDDLVSPSSEALAALNPVK